MKFIKIVIAYPPFPNKLGTPLLSQNRQFQWFHKPTYIYPMVPALAATLLKQAGYEVFWEDGIAEKLTFIDWLSKIKKINPQYLMLETKTPVIKTHWKIINLLKRQLPAMKIILVGDHVTARPEESFAHCKVDYVATGGDYDFAVLNLINHLEHHEKLEGGVYLRGTNGKIKSSGRLMLRHNLDVLPFIDRDLTKWKLYAYENGNYKYFPGTYVMSGRDCWWGRCTFCVWNQVLYPKGTYRSFSPERLLAEIKFLVDKYHAREIFDDAGTFFIGEKLQEFCRLMIKSGYHKKVKLGANMRYGILKKTDYKLMKQAGFRFLLFGMESANQKTLDRLQKGIKIADIIEGSKLAVNAGLEVHATVMIGYPWESLNEAKNTVNFARDCFKKGLFSSLQATIPIPYPGTKLHDECVKNNWLLTQNYDKYDMKAPVMKTPYPVRAVHDLIRQTYSSFLSPQFILRKFLSIRSLDDIKYYAIAFFKYLGHLRDFSKPSIDKCVSDVYS